MKLLPSIGTACLCVLTLAACGETPQTGVGITSDVQAFKGADNNFVAPDWKPGDRASWEQALKVRLQNTQNEYPRLNTSPK